MKTIFIYITTVNETEAKSLAKHLLSKKLIACANIFPIQSLYLWKGKMEEQKETVLLAKTSENMYSKVKAEVEKKHSYDIPCITKIEVKPNSTYQKWLKEQLR